MYSQAPPPGRWGRWSVVAPDVESITAFMHFDVAARHASAEAAVDFLVEGSGGHPTLDLRQDIDWLRLDGAKLAPDAFAHLDLGGGPGAQMRVLDLPLLPDSRHRLEVGYRLGTPSAEGALPVDWQDDGVSFDLWMSDLYPGRYLEMWLPAPMCHDRFGLRLNVEVVGTDRPHEVISNATEVLRSGDNTWELTFSPRFTSLSPMLALAPADSLEHHRAAVELSGRAKPLIVHAVRPLDADVDLPECTAHIADLVTQFHRAYGPWAHGDAFTAMMWSHRRGMEYDGAASAPLEALEHEVFHSWFGRGVKPARASDGWIDEAWTMWVTGPERFKVEELSLDEPPVRLYNSHPWSRFTPTASYSAGARLFAGLAALLGGAEQLRAAMAVWYQIHAGGMVTTDDLEDHLDSWSDAIIRPWWRRYVHGLG